MNRSRFAHPHFGDRAATLDVADFQDELWSLPLWQMTHAPGVYRQFGMECAFSGDHRPAAKPQRGE